MKNQTYKQRASKAGILLTRGGVTSKTVQSHLQDVVKEEIYGVKNEFESKYTDKGNKVEDGAIDYAIQHLNLPFVMKNEEFFEDEHFCGTPDIILTDEIIDVKSSWDCFTFPLFLESIMKKEGEPYSEFRNYYCQLQVYMHLTGIDKARLCYVLMNTPDSVEAWKDKHDYSDVDAKFRIKTFSFEYNPDVIMQLQEGVRDSREYLKQLTASI